MLMVITLAIVWTMVGCGEEEEGMIATVIEIDPPEGSKIAANDEITIRFDNPVMDVTVDGVPAKCSGKTWTFQGDLTGKNGINIEWINEDRSKGEGKIVTYIVIPLDVEPPKIVSSIPENGTKNQEPEQLNSKGMQIKFSEPVKNTTVNVTIEGEVLEWEVQLSEDNMTAKVLVRPGGEIPYESKMVFIKPKMFMIF